MPSFTWSPEQIAAFEQKLATRPHFCRFNHVSLFAKDVELSTKFYAEARPKRGRLRSISADHRQKARRSS